MKHFACNSMENARFRVDISVDEVALHEVYLPHFRRIIDEGVASVMSGYNSVNGEWCGENRVLLTDILRDEWGFEGFVISDWIFGMRDAAQSVKAGLDVEMPYRMVRATHLRDALDARRRDVGGRRPERRADRVDAAAVRRRAERRPRRRTTCSRARSTGRSPARRPRSRSCCCATNPSTTQPVLPLDASALRRVAVIGELAEIVNLGDGGSSDVWAPEVVTILDGLRAALPAAEVVHDDGSDPSAAARSRRGRRCRGRRRRLHLRRRG